MHQGHQPHYLCETPHANHYIPGGLWLPLREEPASHFETAAMYSLHPCGHGAYLVALQVFGEYGGASLEDQTDVLNEHVGYSMSCLSQKNLYVYDCNGARLDDDVLLMADQTDEARDAGYVESLGSRQQGDAAHEGQNAGAGVVEVASIAVSQFFSQLEVRDGARLAARTVGVRKE